MTKKANGKYAPGTRTFSRHRAAVEDRALTERILEEPVEVLPPIERADPVGELRFRYSLKGTR